MVKINMIITTLFYFIAVTQAINITMSKFSDDLFLSGEPQNFAAPTKYYESNFFYYENRMQQKFVNLE